MIWDLVDGTSDPPSLRVFVSVPVPDGAFKTGQVASETETETGTETGTDSGAEAGPRLA